MSPPGCIQAGHVENVLLAIQRLVRSCTWLQADRRGGDTMTEQTRLTPTATISVLEMSVAVEFIFVRHCVSASV